MTASLSSKCTTETHLEKNAFQWVRNPHQKIDQPFAFFCHFWVLTLELGLARVSSMPLWLGWTVLLNGEPQSPCPKDQEQVTHPYVVQHPEKLSQTLWNCARQNFASYTSNLQGPMFCFQRSLRLLPKLTLNPQGRQQSLSPGIDPICSAVPCFPHDIFVGNRLCDECTRSILLVVCHMPESIS